MPNKAVMTDAELLAEAVQEYRSIQEDKERRCKAGREAGIEWALAADLGDLLYAIEKWEEDRLDDLFDIMGGDGEFSYGQLAAWVCHPDTINDDEAALDFWQKAGQDTENRAWSDDRAFIVAFLNAAHHICGEREALK